MGVDTATPCLPRSPYGRHGDELLCHAGKQRKGDVHLSQALARMRLAALASGFDRMD